MSLTNSNVTSNNEASTSSASTDQTPVSSSTSNPSAAQIIGNDNQHLDVFHTLRRRHSSISTFTDISDLDAALNGTSLLLSTTSSTSSSRRRVPPWLSSFWIQNYGALLVLASQFFGALMNLATRLLELPGTHGTPMHPFQILFVRQSITSSVCTIWGLSSSTIPDFPFGPSRPRSIRLLLIARGLCGFFGVFGMYFSLLYLPLSEATVITFLAPILTCYLCSFVLPNETFTRNQQLAGLVSLVGVVCIARPTNFFSSSGHASSSSQTPQNSTLPSTTPPPPSTTTNSTPTPQQHLSAIAIALIGVLGSTGAMTSIRAIGDRAHPFLSINYFSVWCTFVSLFCLVVFPDVKFRLPSNWLEWGLLAMLGSCGFTMQWLLTAGLSYGSTSSSGVEVREEEVRMVVGDEGGEGDVGTGKGKQRRQDRRGRRKGREVVVKGSGTRATSMVYTQMLFALAGDKLVFGVSPGMWSWVGSGLILAGAVWVAAAREEKDVGDDRRGRGFSIAKGRSREVREEEVGLMSGSGDDDPREEVELVEWEGGKGQERNTSRQ